jgi:hypothetical protein
VDSDPDEVDSDPDEADNDTRIDALPRRSRSPPLTNQQIRQTRLRKAEAATREALRVEATARAWFDKLSCDLSVIEECLSLSGQPSSQVRSLDEAMKKVTASVKLAEAAKRDAMFKRILCEQEESDVRHAYVFALA